MTVRKSAVRKEILYDSNWVSWERVHAGSVKAWIQQIKFLDRWLFLVTDEAGHNYKEGNREEDCYRIIEEAFPVAALFGQRKNGAIELVDITSKTTI
ncbi:MAG TPA: hypothetical protein VFG28_00895 [Syntrophales bacterium]|nr:hypothetical protein [Syntrophales bacterium]